MASPPTPSCPRRLTGCQPTASICWAPTTTSLAQDRRQQSKSAPTGAALSPCCAYAPFPTATYGALREFPLALLPGVYHFLPTPGWPMPLRSFAAIGPGVAGAPTGARLGRRPRLSAACVPRRRHSPLRRPPAGVTGQVLGAAYHLPPVPLSPRLLDGHPARRLFHRTDGTRCSSHADPAFAGIIAARPADGRTPQ